MQSNNNMHISSNNFDSTIPGSSSHNDIHISSNNCNIRYDPPNINDDLSSSSSCIFEVGGTFSFSIDNSVEALFRERLVSCLVDNNLKHIQNRDVRFLKKNRFLNRS